MLNLMEHFNVTERDGLSVHRLVEAMKFGFAARYAHPLLSSIRELSSNKGPKSVT